MVFIFHGTRYPCKPVLNHLKYKINVIKETLLFTVIKEKKTIEIILNMEDVIDLSVRFT